MFRGLTRELTAEFLGTFVLITFGVAVVAQVVLSQEQNGQYLSINLGWGMGVTFGAYVAGGVTGAHLNPAVTLALAVHRGFPWRKVLPYTLAQLVGAFAASAVVFMLYYDALNHFDQGVRHVSGEFGTAGIWATYPQSFLRNFPSGLIDQILGTAMLMIGIFALTDKKNMAPEGNFGPLLVGALVVAIGMTMGYNCGYAINPARDFAPRLFTAVAGWGPDVFRVNNYWWWIPIVGPCLGAVLGGFVYDVLVTRLRPQEAEK